MSSLIIQEIEKQQQKDSIPVLFVGDTVVVSKVIVEGQKRRTQRFEGVIVKITGKHSRLSITVRKVIDKIGVEKTFLVHSELVPEITVVKRARVKQARLNYLRDRIGAKASRLKVREDKYPASVATDKVQPTADASKATVDATEQNATDSTEKEPAEEVK